MVNQCFQYGMKSVPCGPTGTQSWIECLATNQKVRGSNPLRRTRNPDTQQGIGIFAMCGNGEKPCGVRLAPQRCFEANRRLRRLLGRDIPYAVPSVKALKLRSFGAFSFCFWALQKQKTAWVHKKVHKPLKIFRRCVQQATR